VVGLITAKLKPYSFGSYTSMHYNLGTTVRPRLKVSSYQRGAEAASMQQRSRVTLLARHERFQLQDLLARSVPLSQCSRLHLTDGENV
jgi:hypothetical protein